MSTFPLVEVTSVRDAISALEHYGEEAKVVAGSTAVTIMLRQRLLEPSALVSIRRIPGLDRIEADNEYLRLGALASLATVEHSPVVAAVAPVLNRAFGVVGNVRVRAAATIGGVVAEADYASDPPCALLALDAEVVVDGPNGRRIVPIADFVLGFYETILEPDELVTAIRVPRTADRLTVVYEKFRTRSSEDRPCVAVAGGVELGPDGRCRQLRLAIGAASEKAERYTDLEARAVGKTVDEELVLEIADGYAERIETLDDMRGSAEYRTDMVRVWSRRTLTDAVAAAGRSCTAP